MGKTTGISYVNHTWNPWQGCRKVSTGCKNCYMYRDKTRFGQDPAAVVRSSSRTFDSPYRMSPGRVLTCSWSDFFIENADEWRDDAWRVIRETPHLTYLVLTKRPHLILDRLPPDWGDGYKNVWLGVSVESWDFLPRIDKLADVPAAIRFVSYEPALGSLGVRFGDYLLDGVVDWVVGGGESGHGSRPAKAQWFIQVRAQCGLFGVPYYHKQNGGNRRVDGEWGGYLLDGDVCRQMPKVKKR